MSPRGDIIIRGDIIEEIFRVIGTRCIRQFRLNRNLKYYVESVEGNQLYSRSEVRTWFSASVD